MFKSCITAFLIPLILISSAIYTDSGGNVENVQKVSSGSSIYTESEIDTAMDAMIRYFEKNFSGCTLTEIKYDEEYNQKQSEDYKSDYNVKDVIILQSVFDVDESGGDGSLNPNFTYDCWTWTLSHTPSGKWEVIAYGHS